MIWPFWCLTFFALILSCMDSGVYGTATLKYYEKCRKLGVIHILVTGCELTPPMIP